jgi:putative phage-type endonuclease
MLEQRSNEWFDIRLGRFTASEIHKLMGVKGLGETGKTYAIEKAIEVISGGNEDEIISQDLKRGIELESLAFNKFKEIKFYEFLNVENTYFFEFGEHSGASPDGLVSDNSTLEIKCPRDLKFFKIVADGKIDDNYIWQMQHQMLSANKEQAYFFNYILNKGKEYWHEIIVPRDERKIDLIKKRLEEAIEIKLNYIEKITANKQW